MGFASSNREYAYQPPCVSLEAVNRATHLLIRLTSY